MHFLFFVTKYIGVLTILQTLGWQYFVPGPTCYYPWSTQVSLAIIG